MYKIALCDDLKSENVKLEEFINEYKLNNPTYDISITTFTSGYDVIDYIEKYGDFDLYFLDIYMKGITGIELATKLRETRKTSFDICFSTTSPIFAIDAYGLDAIQYFVKPYYKDQVFKLLDRIITQKDFSRSNLSMIKKTSGGVRKIMLSDVIYVETYGHYQNVHLSTDETVTVRDTTENMWNTLKETGVFVRCHNSFIVNMRFVKEFTSKEFVLRNKASIPISKRLLSEVKQKYMDFIFGGEK